MMLRALSTCSAVALLAATVLAGCNEPGDWPGGGTGDAEPDGSVSDAADAEEEAIDAATDGPIGREASTDADTGFDSEPDAGAESGSPDAGDDSAGDAEPDAALDAPYPPVCGDGWRDSVTEECDDGLDDTGDDDQACAAGCVVRDRVAASAADIVERRLGLGRHPVAAGDLGQAVVFTEVQQPEAGGDVRVTVATFSPVGERRAPVSFSGAMYESDPVIAALPDGSFAVAYTSMDADGDGLGIALAHVDGAGAAGTITSANFTTEFAQHSPDIVWNGDVVIAGWVDESTIPRRLCVRQFSTTLSPMGGDVALASGEVSNLVLAPFNGGYAAAWRDEAATTDAGPQARTVVWHAGSTWTSSELGLPAAEEKATMGALDASHLLVVFADSDGALYGVVLDTTLQSVWGPAQLHSAGMPGRTPSLAIAPDGAYLSYKTTEETPDPDSGWALHYDDVWIRKLVWDGAVIDLSSEPLPLPHDSWTRDGDQRAPQLASAPYLPSGAVLAAWEDFGVDNYVGQAPHGDVIVSLIPTPIFRGPGLGRSAHETR